MWWALGNTIICLIEINHIVAYFEIADWLIFFLQDYYRYTVRQRSDQRNCKNCSCIPLKMRILLLLTMFLGPPFLIYLTLRCEKVCFCWSNHLVICALTWSNDYFLLNRLMVICHRFRKNINILTQSRRNHENHLYRACCSLSECIK